MIRSLLTFILVLFSTITIGQTDKPVFLKWKLQPKDTLVYKTLMDDIDTLNAIDQTINVGALSKLFGDSTESHSADMENFIKEMKRAVQNTDIVTNMTRNKKGIIDIEMNSTEKPNKKPEAKEGDTTMDAKMQMMLSMLQTGGNSALLRGAIDENGLIQSFYLKNDQKNLVALFFELPGKPVKTGESWQLDVQLISMDQNFKCDTSYRKNNTTLVELKKNGAETIAVIKYDILEYVSGDFSNPLFGGDNKTTMKATYTATAEFSVDKGRWVSYNGLMSIESTGIMTSNVVKKLALIAD